MKERDEPRTSYIHVRGNFLEKGKEVAPGVAGDSAAIVHQSTAQSPCARALAGEPRKSAHGPRHSESLVERVFARAS